MSLLKEGQQHSLKTGRAGKQYFWPNLLPDGRHFLFLEGSGNTPLDLYAGSVDSAEVTFPVKDVSRALYAPPGYLFYVRDGIQAQAVAAHPVQRNGCQSLIRWPLGRLRLR